MGHAPDKFAPAALCDRARTLSRPTAPNELRRLTSLLAPKEVTEHCCIKRSAHWSWATCSRRAPAAGAAPARRKRHGHRGRALRDHHHVHADTGVTWRMASTGPGRGSPRTSRDRRRRMSGQPRPMVMRGCWAGSSQRSRSISKARGTSTQPCEGTPASTWTKNAEPAPGCTGAVLYPMTTA